MSKSGFMLLASLLGLSALGGLAVVVPGPADVGLLPERTCAEWLAHPEDTGPVRLIDCRVDARAPSYREGYGGGLIEESLVIVRPTGWEPAPFDAEASPVLVWHTDDAAVLELTHRVRAVPDDHAYERLLARREGEMTATRVVQGSAIEHDPYGPASELIALDPSIPRDVYVLEDVGHPANFRGLGVVMLLFGLLGLGILVTLQRRWRRTSAALRGGSTTPTRF